MNPHDDKPVRELHKGRFLRLVEKGGWEYIERVTLSRAVAIVAFTENDELILIEQMRPPIGKLMIEVPAGLVGDEPGLGDDPMETARRELLEETGYAVESLEFLTEGPTSPGTSDESVAFFLGYNAKKVAKGGGVGNENIVTHLVPRKDILSWIQAKTSEGYGLDPKVFIGLYFDQIR